MPRCRKHVKGCHLNASSVSKGCILSYGAWCNSIWKTLKNSWLGIQRQWSFLWLSWHCWRWTASGMYYCEDDLRSERDMVRFHCLSDRTLWDRAFVICVSLVCWACPFHTNNKTRGLTSMLLDRWRRRELDVPFLPGHQPSSDATVFVTLLLFRTENIPSANFARQWNPITATGEAAILATVMNGQTDSR